MARKTLSISSSNAFSCPSIGPSGATLVHSLSEGLIMSVTSVGFEGPFGGAQLLIRARRA